MAIRPIQVDGGLVTAKDPSMLQPNELTRADDAEYKPNDPALWKVPGRIVFNSTVEAMKLKGGRYLEFDGAADLIVVHVGGTYRYATADNTGTFANLLTGLTGGSSLDSTHYNNKHVLMNGVDRNRVVSSDGTVAFQGMLANTAVPTLSRDAGVGTGFILTSGKTIVYWVEERVKSGTTVLRRSAETGSFTVTLTGDGTTDKPVITRPAAVNSDATHWALFATATNGNFPVGAEVAEVAIGTTTIEDTRTGTDPSLPTGATYQIVTVSLAGTSTNVAKNGPPPISDTGDVAEDSIVMNDTSDRSKVWYTFYDNIDAVPSVNVIRFETKEADVVTCIRTLGHTPIVLMRDSAHRINTLPRAEDASFQTERVKDKIAGARGCVGPSAACTFTVADGSELLASVTLYGLDRTDGFSWGILADDLDWPHTFDVTQLSSATLINNPAKFRLEMDAVTSDGATRRAYFFHYHPSHIKQTDRGWRLAVTGPINRSATCALVAKVNAQDVVFTGTAAGYLYREGTGLTDASGAGGIRYVARTGRQYVNAVMGEAKMGRVAYHHTAGTAEQSATAHLIAHTEGQDDYGKTSTISLARNEKTTAFDQTMGEAFQLGLENSDSLGPFGLNAIFADFVPLGQVAP